MTSQQGKFITIEGMEGVGKSTNLHFIADWLRQNKKQVVVTREPGGTLLAEAIRKILLADYPEVVLPKTELLLFYAGRLQHVEHVIKPSLLEGKWVICDRFTDATYAYQGAGRAVSQSVLDVIHQWTLGTFAPHHTVLLDAPVDIVYERLKQRQALDRFEKEAHDFFQRIRSRYLDMAKNNRRYHVINAADPLKAVQAQLSHLLAGWL